MTLESLLASPWLGPALLATAGAAMLLALAALMLRRRRRMAAPAWQRLVADTDYFRRVLSLLFPAQGYQVTGYRIFRDPLEEEAREILYSLRKEGRLYAALCVRWIVPVTSDVISRFEQALAVSRADEGLLVTTSRFTDAARERARGLPVALYDQEDLGQWIEAVWG